MKDVKILNKEKYTAYLDYIHMLLNRSYSLEFLAKLNPPREYHYDLVEEKPAKKEFNIKELVKKSLGDIDDENEDDNDRFMPYGIDF